MRLGDVANETARANGKPLDGLRVLAIEQMQALPFATQLLARLGADVMKVELPGRGDLARGSQPAVPDASGRPAGATFLRNNLGKRSIAIDLKHPRGRELLLALAPRFDVVAENSRAGAMDRLGLGYDDIARVHPACIYVSVSGFGNRSASPYRAWPALAPVVEAMSGIYAMRSTNGTPPMVAPMGAVGDIGAALFATIGVLAAVLHRQRTGEGQHVDVAMLDSMVAMTDIVTNLWSLGVQDGVGPLIMDSFRAADGWFVLQVTRETQFAVLADLVGHAEWVTDPRFATRQGWVEHLETVLRPAIEVWAHGRTKLDACAALAGAGLAAGPCLVPDEVVADEHLAVRNMLVEIPRPDGIDRPVLTPGNPVKLSKMSEGPEGPMPSLGQHSDEVLRSELGLDPATIATLRADGVVG